MKEIDCKTLDFNPFKTVADDWFALGAGTKDGYSAMAISWGNFGAIYGHGWGDPSVVIYVRPQRRTRHFVDEEKEFSLSLLPKEDQKKVLYLGQHSGGDAEKIKEAGLTPAFYNGVFYIKEAKLVFICRKIYRGKLEESNFLDTSILPEHYSKKDYHYLYMASIEKTLVKD